MRPVVTLVSRRPAWVCAFVMATSRAETAEPIKMCSIKTCRAQGTMNWAGWIPHWKGHFWRSYFGMRKPARGRYAQPYSLEGISISDTVSGDQSTVVTRRLCSLNYYNSASTDRCHWWNQVYMWLRKVSFGWIKRTNKNFKQPKQPKFETTKKYNVPCAMKPRVTLKNVLVHPKNRKDKKTDNRMCV